MLNKNYFADCIKFMDSMPPRHVDLVLTDPPYNASAGGINLPKNKTGGAYFKVKEEWDIYSTDEYLEFTKKWIGSADRILKPGGSIIVCASYHNLAEIILALKERGFKFLNIITWKKSNPMPNITKRTLTHSTEFIVWFTKGKKWTFNYNDMKKYNEGKQLRDVWEFSLCQGAERIKGPDKRAAHPTQKPLQLFKRLVEMTTNEEEIVIDPFMGSGTTAIACIELKRSWIGIDSSKKYISLANNRIKEHKTTCNNNDLQKNNKRRNNN